MRIAVARASGLVGSQATNLAHEAGHDVVRLSRSDGIDLTDPRGLVQALADVEAVIDVTRSPSMDKQTAIDFFTTVSTNLGRASVEAGVHRTVVLSIVGIEDAQDFDWYVVTLAHERASRASCPGVCVVRSTQFHEFPGQVLARSRVEDRALVMDVPTQPVDSGEVARALIETATDPECTDWELAGPKVERLVDLVRLLVAHTGENVKVEPRTAPPSMAAGSMLPGAHALVRGPDWRTWLSARP